MGYVTTYEEYQQQAYEGGHTLFGQWTLAACQSKFKLLAEQLLLDKNQRNYDQTTTKTDSRTGTRKTQQSWQFKTAVSQGEAV